LFDRFSFNISRTADLFRYYDSAENDNRESDIGIQFKLVGCSFIDKKLNDITIYATMTTYLTPLRLFDRFSFNICRTADLFRYYDSAENDNRESDIGIQFKLVGCSFIDKKLNDITIYATMTMYLTPLRLFDRFSFNICRTADLF
jgi:hypothetical protein